MRYIKAEDILPEEVIRQIQQYADGVTVYIPRRAENRRGWGCGTGYRRELAERNSQIIRQHCQGVSIPALAERYHLTEKSIRRIIRGTK